MNPTFRRRESACRNLFGPVDHEQLRRDLQQRLQEMTEQDSRRWNFNFQTNTPMSGRFEWEEIPADCAAAAYQESAERTDRLCSTKCAEKEEEEERLCAKIDQENCSSISNTHKCPAEVTPVRRKRTHGKTAGKPRNTLRITDFFAKRRRSTETKILNPVLTEAAQCRTIRS